MAEGKEQAPSSQVGLGAAEFLPLRVGPNQTSASPEQQGGTQVLPTLVRSSS